jgi:hypothetical protein
VRAAVRERSARVRERRTRGQLPETPRKIAARELLFELAMKKMNHSKPLNLATETLRRLDNQDLALVQGGRQQPTSTPEECTEALAVLK